ncbi:hypothetical protein [Thiothrix fructosivorans]|uniref:Uncharacterized protein n=1 Tax=Thiothrix fructosivorans TaxID=111770 RepID=A0A8B0SI83_9GAMM|nr:hypothetical protein [Thiothrix fructosivorans]MBO0612647.1 hypothetical protein [Thiothrix fructosivorans]QTX11883.1 hypothetical protein J1836_005975 [Thiothrix fructosivorans]
MSLALAGLLAGFSGEAKGAAAGSLIGNLIDIPNTRYNFEVQSVNYAKASDAMACMYDYLESQEQTRSLSYKLLNAKIYQVHRKLNILQNDVQLAEPDLKVIESALSEIKKERDAQNIRDTSARRSTPSEPSEKEKIAELDSCIAAFSK